MPRKPKTIRYQRLDLAGGAYAVLPERVLLDLCRRAGVAASGPDGSDSSAVAPPSIVLDPDRLAERLVARRKRAGLSQAELARRAKVRVETLNRIERGKTEPDFATIRKLVVAISKAEAAAPPVDALL